MVGLDGTGDQTSPPFTTQTLNNMLSQLGITVPTGTNMQLKNVAGVMVGQRHFLRLDVRGKPSMWWFLPWEMPKACVEVRC
ncbi:flagellar basal body P-ring protein FlgI [Escherichia coli]